MQDGDDVLRNLPRSRPGRRSDKRDKPAASKPRPKASRQSPAASRQETATAEPGPDPVGDAVRVAGRAAEAGLKVATGVTRELLRRLPRP